MTDIAREIVEGPGTAADGTVVLSGQVYLRAERMGAMTDIVERLRFDAARCEATFSKGVATNIEEAAAEIERLRAALGQAREWFLRPDNMDLPGSDAVYIAIDAAFADEQKESQG